ncbi:DUF2637 domain-containing protein [Mycobacterium avium]|uniref:DUF2637 domain-containing protein n=1 Tax=Mycobacterium avium TaxID=1764 RepID=UPI00111BDE5F|nr:DUF2637 domain-containing protein [Mycobacterium avium]
MRVPEDQSASIIDKGSAPSGSDHGAEKPVASTHVSAANDCGDDLLSGRMLQLARVVAVLITAVVGIASFVLSFASLSDLAERSGYPHELAPLWPLIVDLTIVLATAAVVVLGPSGAKQRKDRRFFWQVLAVAALVSISCNGLHGFLPKNAALSPWLAAAIATVAPVSLLATAHGAAILSRVKTQTDNATTLLNIANAATRESITAATGIHKPDVARRNGEVPRLHSAVERQVDRAALAMLDRSATSGTDWTDVAETLVRDGVTTKTAAETTEVLRLWEMHTPHNTIARRLGLHRDTVAKIIDSAEDLLSGTKIRA